VFNREIKIGNCMVGDGHPCFIIAELGYNFTTMEEAFESIDAAADCGVDSIKFQTFTADTIVARDSVFPEEAGGTNFFASQWEEFKRFEITLDQHRALFKRAVEKGLVPFSTPSYYDDVELLDKLNVCAYKTGADDLTNVPFQAFMAKRGKPMILSSGMSYLWEVGRTIQAIEDTGNKDVIVLHTLSNYPVNDISELNLKAMKTMADGFGILTGFSDHTKSLSIPAAGVALGMSIYERHFTLDKKIQAPDCPFSADPKEMKTLVDVIRETEAALGNGIKVPAGTEKDMRRETRKSLMAKTDLKAGEILTKDNTIVKRPGTGIPPYEVYAAYGKKLNKNIKADGVISWHDIGQ